MKPQRELGIGKKGMNKDNHVTSLDEQSYIHALNANFQGQDGDSVNLQNEESNILCSRFVDGFHVIGIQHDTTGERTYFFLTNPETGESEIGYIKDLEKQISFSDTLKECDCDISTVLSSGLESVAQEATCEYITLITDHGGKLCEGGAEGTGCLNFNVNYPISSIIKQEKCGDVLYFTDDLNPRRRVEVAKPEQYSTRTEFCEEGTPGCDCGRREVSVCLNCDKMSIIPKHEKMCIDVEGTVVGGKTRHGQYIFFAGYCDVRGNLINSYAASSGPCSINDLNREVYQQFELDTLTNLSIKLKIDNLDPTFDYYKVAVLQFNAVDGTANAFTVDVLPTSTKEVLYSGSQELTNIPVRELARELPDYLVAKTVTQANNQLFFSDLEGRPDPNLQPVVNFMGQFAKWRTVMSEEGLYSTARGTSTFKGYMRDEVVPFGIRFITNENYKTPVYPLIPRAATNDDLYFDSDHQASATSATTNTLIDNIANTTHKKDLETNTGYTLIDKPWMNDVYSVFNNGDKGCAEEPRIYKWQFYNTGYEDETATPGGLCGEPGSDVVYRIVERICSTQKDFDLSSLTSASNVVIEIDEDEYNYTTFLAFINERQEDIQASINHPDNGPANDEFLRYFLKSSYYGSGAYASSIPCCFPDASNGSDLFDSGCSTPSPVGDPIIDFESFLGTEPDIVEITVDCDDVERPEEPGLDTFLEVNADGDLKNINDANTIGFNTDGDDENGDEDFLDEFEFWVGDRKDKDKDEEDNGKYDWVFERTRPFSGSFNCSNPSKLTTNYSSSTSFYPFVFHISPEFPSIDIDGDLVNNDLPPDPVINNETNDPYDQIIQLVDTDLPAGFGGGLSGAATARTSNGLATSSVNGVPHTWFRADPFGANVPTIDIPEIGDRIKKDNCYQRGDLYEDGFFAKSRTVEVISDAQQFIQLRGGAGNDQGFVHSNAVFYEVDLDNSKPKLVLSLSDINEGGKKKRQKDCLWYPAYVRVSLFTACKDDGTIRKNTLQNKYGTTTVWQRCGGYTGTDPFIDQNSFLCKIGLRQAASGGGAIDDGGIFKIEIDLEAIRQLGASLPQLNDLSSIIIAIDTPLVSVTHEGTNPKSDFRNKGLGSRLPDGHTRQYFYASGTWGVMAIKADFPRVDKLIITNPQDIDLQVSKLCRFNSRCPFTVYDDIICDPVPSKEGYFSYWESTINYPNNNFLYDSTTRDDGTDMVITTSDIPSSIRTSFEDVFVDSTVDGVYTLSDSADFSCKPIRHFRFPDFNTSPAFDRDALPFSKNNIFPIGFYLDNEVINAFLDIAKNNGYITEEFRDSITHYEIFRGDTRFDRSIIAKGLLYDMIEAPEQKVGSDRSQFFSNFPYNDLSDNNLIYADADREDYIPHPFKTSKDGGAALSNNRFSFHSPEIHFNKPILPFEMYVESHFRGSSRGSFLEVKNHPVFTILSPRAHRLAGELATAEVALDITLNTATALISTAQALSGFPAFGAVMAGIGLAMVIGAYAAEQVQDIVRKKVEWEQIFYNRGKRHNFAYYYSSLGHYNQFSKDDSNLDGHYGLTGNKLRGLKERLYLKNGTYRVNEAFDKQETVINNIYRESLVYLSLGSEIEQPDPADASQDVLNYSFNLEVPGFHRFADQSRFKVGDKLPSHLGNKTEEFDTPIGSPYVSLKLFLPNQYGDINSVKYIYTAYCGDLSKDNDCDVVFGGDTFINRFYIKRKYPFYLSPMIDGNNSLSDLLPFDYREVRNIGYPKYYLSYKMSEEDAQGGFGNIPNMVSEYEFDNFAKKNKYIVPPSKFYLYYYGIPGFMVESSINLDFRYGENEDERGFYPAQSNFYDWTQESNVPIREDNYFFYWNTYSQENAMYSPRTLPENYDPAEWNCRFDFYDRTIYSLPDNSEQDLLDNYRIFLANNYYDFGSKYGNLKALHSIESLKVIGLFENGAVVFNAYSTIAGTTEDFQVGNSGIFQNRPQEYFKSELGYGGTQHRAFASCEFGHYWVDAKRGRVYTIKPGGAGFEEISRNGMTNWFRENLPFRIKQQFENAGIDVPNDLIDNAYEGLGISMVWDDRYSRLFITKLDAKVKSGITLYNGPKETMPCTLGGTITIDKRYEDDKEKLDFWYLSPSPLCEGPTLVHPQTHPNIFDSASWTISYSPLTQTWVSFHSFLPNYYVAHNNYFSSGLNFGNTGIWNHLLGSNQTFQVYYGALYPWIIEVPVKQNYQTRMYEDFSYTLDVRRYSNEYDYHYYQENFDTAVFYNDRESTGLLNLITQQQNNQQQLIELPRFTGSGVDVLATKSDYTWSINFFLDNLRENHTLPIWTNATNNVGKSLNTSAFNYQPSFKNRIRGQYLIARLSQNNESRLKYIFQHFVSDSYMYDAY